MAEGFSKKKKYGVNFINIANFGPNLVLRYYGNVQCSLMEARTHTHTRTHIYIYYIGVSSSEDIHEYENLRPPSVQFVLF